MLVLVLHIALFPSEKNITQIDKVLGKYNGENKRKKLDKLDDALALDDDNGVHDNY